MTRLVASLVAIGIVLTACGGPPTSAGASEVAVAGAAPAPVVVRLVAKDIELTPAEVQVPAGSPLSVEFDDRDAGIPHGLQLASDTTPPVVLAARPVSAGPGTDSFTVPGLVPGRYVFSCQVHPMMVAVLRVD